MPKKLACMPNSPQQGLQFGALSGLGMQTPLRMQVCPMSVATPDCGCSLLHKSNKWHTNPILVLSGQYQQE